MSEKSFKNGGDMSNINTVGHHSYTPLERNNDLPVFTRKADEELERLRARNHEMFEELKDIRAKNAMYKIQEKDLKRLIKLTVDDLRMRSRNDVVNISDFIWQQLKEATE